VDEGGASLHNATVPNHRSQRPLTR